MIVHSRTAIACATAAITVFGFSSLIDAETLPQEPVSIEVSTPSLLTDVEKNEFAMGVARCWNVGALATDSLRISVTISLSLDQEGKPDRKSILMESFEGGTPEAAKSAFEVARRAIIRCGVSGYDLPPKKYDTWKDLSLVFDPKGIEMR